jgi:hypothetical protein
MKIEGRSARSSSHTDSRMSRNNGDSHHAKASFRFGQENPKFLCCIFLFPKAKTALRGKRFQNAEEKRDGRTECVSLQALLAVFKTFLRDSTNIFKWAQITLKKKTIFYFLVFVFLFSQQSGFFIVRLFTCIHIYIL